MDKNKGKFLNYTHLFYLSIAAFGIQFATALEMNNTSGFFKFLGATDKQVGFLWLIAPITGLVVQPVLGQFSDVTNNKYGRRIPYIFGCMVLACITLLMMAFSGSVWLTAFTLIILDCAINGATESLRALVGDIAPNEQKHTAFAWQAVFSGVGAMVGSLLPWFLESTHIFAKTGEVDTKIPVIMKIAFMIGCYALFKSVWAMVKKIKEKEFIEYGTEPDSLSIKRNHFEFIINVFRELTHSLKHMPYVIRRFFLIQIFTWAALFCLWLYFGIALAQHLYGLPAGANVLGNPVYQRMLEKGFVEEGICFGIYQSFSIIYVLTLPKLARIISPYKIHAASLLIGGISLISVIFLKDIWLIYYAMLGLGVLWGSIVTMPYSIISAAIPPEKMGTYLGVFNITITVPQIACGLFIGIINEKIFFGHAIFTILLSGIFLTIAGIILFNQEGQDLTKVFRVWLMKIFKIVEAYNKKGKSKKLNDKVSQANYSKV